MDFAKLGCKGTNKYLFFQNFLPKVLHFRLFCVSLSPRFQAVPGAALCYNGFSTLRKAMKAYAGMAWQRERLAHDCPKTETWKISILWIICNNVHVCRCIIHLHLYWWWTNIPFGVAYCIIIQYKVISTTSVLIMYNIVHALRVGMRNSLTTIKA